MYRYMRGRAAPSEIPHAREKKDTRSSSSSSGQYCRHLSGLYVASGLSIIRVTHPISARLYLHTYIYITLPAKCVSEVCVCIAENQRGRFSRYRVVDYYTSIIHARADDALYRFGEKTGLERERKV